MRQLHPLVVDFINRKYGLGAVVAIDEVWYWSRIRFQFTIAGVLAVSTRQAFAVAAGDDMAPAGFAVAGQPGSRTATAADSSLLEKGKTRLNSDLFVEGLAAYVMPRSDSALLQRIMEECDVQMSTDGQTFTPLCTLERLPAASGLHGTGKSAIKSPPLDTAGLLDGGEGARIYGQTNGMPDTRNIFSLGAPVLWSGVTGRDSNFRLNFNIGAAITETPAVARAAAAGIEAFTLPAAVGDVGTFVDLRIGARALAISKPSVNSGG